MHTASSLTETHACCFLLMHNHIGSYRLKFMKRNVENNDRITLPLSKSMAARLLILDYIHNRELQRVDLPDCDDTRDLERALRQLKSSPCNSVFNLGFGATSQRFFIALAAALEGFEGIVDCSAQLRRRPLSQLVDVLQAMGADIRYMEKPGFAPLYIKGRKLKGGDVEMDASVSSQYISAVMLISPLCETPANIILRGEVVSRPYMEMTKKIISGYNKDMQIEPDWSAATFFYEAAMLHPGKRIEIENLTPPSDSVQGDSGVCALFEALGVRTLFNEDGSATLIGDADKIKRNAESEEPFVADMSAMPDAVPALTPALALNGIRFKLTGIAHLRHKESDRLEAMRAEMLKIGYVLTVGEDSLSWNGDCVTVENPVTIDSYADHRIAMAFAIASTKIIETEVGKLNITDITCVSKSFPNFFGEERKLKDMIDTWMFYETDY